MKKLKLLHNPKAGDEEHSRKELVSLIESRGFLSEYASIKEKNWDKIDKDVDFLVIAGGDGTVRKVIKQLINRKFVEKRPPLALFPLGTANNLANTLDLPENPDAIIDAWKSDNRRPFDVGLIYGLKDTRFFLEGIGFGIFPFLMSRMKKVDKKYKDTPEKKLEAALEILTEIVASFEPENFEIETNESKYVGKYLMVEIMNTRSIGPNLNISPSGDPGDGQFELVLIPEQEREKLIKYLEQKINQQEIHIDFSRIKCRKVKIAAKSNRLHVDDELLKLDGECNIEVQIQDGLFNFLI